MNRKILKIKTNTEKDIIKAIFSYCEKNNLKHRNFKVINNRFNIEYCYHNKGTKKEIVPTQTNNSSNFLRPFDKMDEYVINDIGTDICFFTFKQI